jgi:hypothetical protein
MFERISHLTGIVSEDEILFSTRFDYLFPEAARSRLCLVPDTEECSAGLRALGTAMASDDLVGSPDPDESGIPAIFTYFGQFIDHDVTARTDREGMVTSIGRAEPINRLDPDFIVANLRNGRRPAFDLDSVFGEAPGLSGLGGAKPARTVSNQLYGNDFQLKLFRDGPRRDLPRSAARTAIIPDGRNDENPNLSQLQFALMAFYNAVHDAQAGGDARAYIRARQLCSWAFQYVVIHDWLKTVCEPLIVEDTLANGPRFFGNAAGQGGSFVPLEFSVAGFRFAHSLIRPSYRANAAAPEVSITDMLGFAANPDFFFDPVAGGVDHLKQQFVIDWNFFARGGSNTQFARKLDSRIARGLGDLALGSRRDDPVLGHLARANLLRSKNLSIPIGQAVADAFGVLPLSPAELLDGEDAGIADVLRTFSFHQRSPLWYYVLREAKVQQDGERLGEVGSRLVCETIIGLIRNDPTSYLNNRHDPAVRGNGIDVIPGPGGVVNEIVDMLRIAGVY